MMKTKLEVIIVTQSCYATGTLNDGLYTLQIYLCVGNTHYVPYATLLIVSFWLFHHNDLFWIFDTIMIVKLLEKWQLEII